jgi:hypothetical protein
MNITNQIMGKIISISPLSKPITGISITGTKKYRKIPCVLNSLNIFGSVGLKVFIVSIFTVNKRTNNARRINNIICHISNSILKKTNGRNTKNTDKNRIPNP